MRLLHLYSGNLYGGVETLLVTLARERHHVPEMEAHFGLCYEGRLRDELDTTGVAVHRLSPVRFSRPTSLVRARRELAALLQAESFDLIVCHAPWALAVFGPSVRAANMALVLWLHNPTRPRHWLDGWAQRTTPDLVLCNSRYTAESAAGYTAAPVEWLHLPVRLTLPADRDGRRDALRRQLDTPREAVVIVQASRLEAWKGHRVLIDALAALKDRPGWVAWIAGGP